MPNIAILSAAHVHTKSFLKNIVEKTAVDGRCAYAIWDDVADRGKRYAEEFGTRYVGRLGKVLGDKKVDAFVICAENTQHLPLLRRALKVGKPVMCEKPICTRTRDAKKVIALLSKYPTSKLMSGYFQPFSGVMQTVARMMASRALGAVTRVRFRNSHNAAYGHWFDNPDSQWFTIPKLSGGGALLDLGTHAVHLLRTLFGPVREVWATAGNQSGIYTAVDDFGISHMRFASGVLGTVEAAWTQTGGIGGLEITGSDGTLHSTGKQYVVSAPGKESAPVEPAAAKPDRIERLLAVVRGEVGEDELRADLTAAIDSVSIIEAMYASATSGRWTKVKSAWD
jgi:predicted dehydrogenase